jgi:hypothetical protein
MTNGRRDVISVTLLLLTPYRSLVELGTNYAGAQSEFNMACGVLNFDMDTAGRRAIDLILMDIRRNFNGKLWGNNGPKVIDDVLQFMCRTKHVSMVSLNDCWIYNSGRYPFSCVPPSGVEASPNRLNSRKFQFTTDPVWAQTPESQPTKVLNNFLPNKCSASSNTL